MPSRRHTSKASSDCRRQRPRRQPCLPRKCRRDFHPSSVAFVKQSEETRRLSVAVSCPTENMQLRSYCAGSAVSYAGRITELRGRCVRRAAWKKE